MTSLRTRSTAWLNQLALVMVIGLAVSFLFLSQVQVSWGHSRFVSANIQPDAVVTTVPATLTVTFDEETSPTQTKLQVLDASGKAVDKGDLKISGAVATLGLGTLADGKYTVKFRTFTEDDSNIVEGEYSFTVAKAGTAASGDAGKANQVESVGSAEQPAGVPATGFGGNQAASTANSIPLLEALSGLGIIGLVGLSLSLIVARKRSQSRNS